MQSLPSPSQTSAHHGDAASEANSCPEAEEGKSDVARLLRQIDLEYEAAQQGITGLAVGTARHDFINARMEQVAVYQEQLATCVGETEATRLIYDHYAQHIG
jgi:hypothetical protein